ncbi:hypothetical protein PoB_002523700 [Plakobranchus ocellatus]|uniref:Uncharacterized protein n=1 Tax=Plakobranchus ocellatus TaxID=259542 RepID=A0AAV3ZUF7_9GAST|nr:hypothetical protein PoB_002523700 [Plakobranchus ocellatus]
MTRQRASLTRETWHLLRETPSRDKPQDLVSLSLSPVGLETRDNDSTQASQIFGVSGNNRVNRGLSEPQIVFPKRSHTVVKVF